MDTRRRRQLLRSLRWFALACALAVIALAVWQGRPARGLRYRWRPSLPAAEQHDSQPMPRWYADRG